MFVTKKRFEKMVEEEWERFESKATNDDLGIQAITGCLFGSESALRPWELLSPARSLYFPWGRKRCRKNLEYTIDAFINDFFYRRIDIVGVGPFGKIAMEVLEKKRNEQPDMKVRVWIPGPVSAHKMAQDNRHFSRYDCSFVYFDYPDSLLRMEIAMAVRADTCGAFDLNPRANERFKYLYHKTGVSIFNLANKNFKEEAGIRDE